MTDSDDTRVLRLYDQERPRPSQSSPDLVQRTYALIDRVLRQHDVDPEEVTDRAGWRHITPGGAHVLAGVVEWGQDGYYLVVAAPVLELPAEVELPGGFYRVLLELNHQGTLSAHFSISDDVLFVAISRPALDLDPGEIEHAISVVLTVAQGSAEWLPTNLQIALSQISLPPSELPNLKMTPKEAQSIGGVLLAADPHGREILRYIMEAWQRTGGILTPLTNVGLKIAVGERTYGLGGLGNKWTGHALLILSWQGLHSLGIFPEKAIERYQKAVAKIAPLQINESTAHIEVTEDFTLQSAKAWVTALRKLASTAHGPA